MLLSNMFNNKVNDFINSFFKKNIICYCWTKNTTSFQTSIEKNKVAGYSQNKKKSLKKNKVASYFEIKKKLKEKIKLLMILK